MGGGAVLACCLHGLEPPSSEVASCCSLLKQHGPALWVPRCRAVQRPVANPAADTLVAAAVASAHSLRPRLGQDLEARVARWAGAVGAGAAAAGRAASLVQGRAPASGATKSAGQGFGKQLPSLARA